jgi:hypothetical protein
MSEKQEDLIAEAITEQFGERCPDFDANCYCCRVWRQYDELKTIRHPDTLTDEAKARRSKAIDDGELLP